MTTDDPINPKIAKTKFRNRWVIADKYTLLEIDLLTWRTHQIRVHLSSIGYPILGDNVYGREKENALALENYHLKRQWLHAYKLKFQLFGESFEFIGPLKDDLLFWSLKDMKFTS
jgi:23S rRNA-/tRNA-specific pseudouridylate synthase